MLLRVAEDVEAVGLGVARLVAVRRADGDAEHRSRFDGHAAQLGVDGRHPCDAVERRLPSQPFLDRLRQQRTVGAHRLELVGVGEQAEQQVARRAVGGLDARRQQQAQEREDLLVAQRVPVDLRVGQVADEVVGGRGAATVDDVLEVVAQLLRSGDPAIPVGAHADQLERPALEARVVAPREPEDARDDLHGEREGELADELSSTVAAPDERVDELVHHRGDELGLPARERLLAERLGHQTAVVTVLGLVHLEDGVAHHRAHHRRVDLGRERVVVAQHLRHQVVAVDGVLVGQAGRCLDALQREDARHLHRGVPAGFGQVGPRVAHVARQVAERLVRVVLLGRGLGRALGRAHGASLSDAGVRV